MSTQRPNHALQRTRPSRSGCNPRVLWAGSLSFGRSATMRVITKWAAISLCLGAAATVLVSLVEYQYCMDGAGRGWPFAIVHPAHLRLTPGSPAPKRGDEVFSILLAPPAVRRPSGLSYPPEVNFLAIIGDIALWGAAAFFIVGWFQRTRRKVGGKGSEE